MKNGTAWFEKHLIIIVAIGLSDNWLLKCINTTNNAHSNLDMSISVCVYCFLILTLFSPFPRAFVARTQIYNQTQIHQNSSVPLDIIV